MSLRIGTAGWSIPRRDAAQFPKGGSALKRYAQRLGATEVNSSFYRSHRPSTWSRWRESVPPDFRFAAKVPKAITHDRKLVDCGELIASFLNEVSALEEKLAVLLLQLPPKLEFEPRLVVPVLEALCSRTGARVVCEPRHASWFHPEPDRLLAEFEVARVAADPARVPAAASPGGWRGLSYWRLHGSPQMYRSSYGPERLDGYAASLRREADAGRPAWCMFDNTASSAAMGDCLALVDRLER